MQPITVTLELVKQAQGGDDGALNRLFERYYPRVRKVVRARIGARLRSRLETTDLLQQTFMTAVRKFDEFAMRDEASLIHWLATLAQNQIRDAAKYHNAERRSADQEVDMDRPVGGDTSGPRMDLPDDATAPLDRIARTEHEQLLEQAMDGLSEEHREVIVLRDFEGFSWGDIAQRLGNPSPDAARMFHGTAKAKLAAALRAAGAGG